MENPIISKTLLETNNGTEFYMNFHENGFGISSFRNGKENKILLPLSEESIVKLKSIGYPVEEINLHPTFNQALKSAKEYMKEMI